MTQNTRTPAELCEALNAIVAEFRVIEAACIAAADLVPLMKSIQDVCAYGATTDAQIQLRALTNGEMIPGVATKDAVVHRKWHDQEAAEQLAFEQFGERAFSRTLLSPAGIEKLGAEGKTFVAVASYKPVAGKRVVY